MRTLPPTDSLEGLSLAQLRGPFAALIGIVRGLQGRVESLEIENQALRAEIQTLMDRPPDKPTKPTKPSEWATQPASGKGKRRRRGAKRDGGRVSREVTVAVSAPAGSRFKGYETILVRDLVLSDVMRYRRECWVTPSGERLVAPLPAGIVGGWARTCAASSWPVTFSGRCGRRDAPPPLLAGYDRVRRAWPTREARVGISRRS